VSIHQLSVFVKKIPADHKAARNYWKVLNNQWQLDENQLVRISNQLIFPAPDGNSPAQWTFTAFYRDNA